MLPKIQQRIYSVLKNVFKVTAVAQTLETPSRDLKKCLLTENFM